MHILELQDEILLHVGVWLDHSDICNLILAGERFSRIYQDQIFLLKKINIFLKSSGQSALSTQRSYEAGVLLKLFHWLYGTWNGIMGAFGVSSASKGTLFSFQFDIETHRVIVDYFSLASHYLALSSGFRHQCMRFLSDNTGQVDNNTFSSYRIDFYPHTETTDPVEQLPSLVPAEPFNNAIKNFRHNEFKFDVFQEDAVSIVINGDDPVSLLKLKPIAIRSDYSFPIPLDPGWFIARYSSHGLELLDVRFVQKGNDYFVIGTKLIGDDNVPCYQHSFCVKYDPFGKSLENKMRMAYPAPSGHVDLIDENEKVPTYYTSRFEGGGTIARGGFRSPEWTHTALYIVNNDKFRLDFISLHHTMVFKRVADFNMNCQDITEKLQTEYTAECIDSEDLEIEWDETDSSDNGEY